MPRTILFSGLVKKKHTMGVFSQKRDCTAVPARTAVSFWGQTTCNLTGFVPKTGRKCTCLSVFFVALCPETTVDVRVLFVSLCPAWAGIITTTIYNILELSSHAPGGSVGRTRACYDQFRRFMSPRVLTRRDFS